MENFKTGASGNSRDTSDTSSDAILPSLEAMSMDLEKDTLALPAGAKLGAPAPPWDGIKVRIWENVS